MGINTIVSEAAELAMKFGDKEAGRIMDLMNNLNKGGTFLGEGEGKPSVNNSSIGQAIDSLTK